MFELIYNVIVYWFLTKFKRRCKTTVEKIVGLIGSQVGPATTFAFTETDAPSCIDKKMVNWNIFRLW